MQIGLSKWYSTNANAVSGFAGSSTGYKNIWAGMVLNPSVKNVEWLIERLYACRWRLDMSAQPVFVLLTKDLRDRERAETVMLHYFQVKYGILATRHFLLGEATQEYSRFELPEAGLSVILMDV